MPLCAMHAFFICVLDLAHFGNCVRNLDNCGVRVPARQDDMHHLRLSSSEQSTTFAGSSMP